ncbi:transcriptional repressor TraM [Rhizobium sp. YTUHZ044]|uniref:transcriptional repressor TraM n=1 Tax=Rhizobium sp. YTUHZ044 TaxID=2962678 RepID=UPI003DA7F0AD
MNRNKSFEIPAVIGLTRGISSGELETLTVDAIRSHRQRVERAQQLWELLPDAHEGKTSGGTQHLAYVEAAMEMHGQMRVLHTLLNQLGYIPKVSVN